jgi:hypothetical protein
MTAEGEAYLLLMLPQQKPLTAESAECAENLKVKTQRSPRSPRLNPLFLDELY